MKKTIERDYFEKGLSELVNRLTPRTIIVYGSAPDEIFKKYKEQGIDIVQFDSQFAETHKVVSA